MEYYEIAYAVAWKFLAGEIPADDLLAIVHEAYNFPVPLEQVCDEKYVMRLDQGPTASFKDFAARMMGRLMQYFLKQDNRKLLILTATSGDTMLNSLATTVATPWKWLGRKGPHSPLVSPSTFTDVACPPG